LIEEYNYGIKKTVFQRKRHKTAIKNKPDSLPRCFVSQVLFVITLSAVTVIYKLQAGFLTYGHILYRLPRHPAQWHSGTKNQLQLRDSTGFSPVFLFGILRTCSR